MYKTQSQTCGFGSPFLHRMLKLPKEAPAVDWLHGLIGPGGMLLIISDLLDSSGVGKK
jgi:hypothetical protein